MDKQDCRSEDKHVNNMINLCKIVCWTRLTASCQSAFVARHVAVHVGRRCRDRGIHSWKTTTTTTWNNIRTPKSFSVNILEFRASFELKRSICFIHRSKQEVWRGLKHLGRWSMAYKRAEGAREEGRRGGGREGDEGRWRRGRKKVNRGGSRKAWGDEGANHHLVFIHYRAFSHIFSICSTFNTSICLLIYLPFALFAICSIYLLLYLPFALFSYFI